MTNLELPQLTLGAVLRSGAVGVFPIFARSELPRADYRLASTMMGEGKFEIRESSPGGVVGTLEARNKSPARVLIIEGDHVIGAKQNRMLTSSVLVGGRCTVAVPASCVEQGRWQGATERFAGMATMAPSKLRRIAKLSVTRSVLADGGRAADQGQIWGAIAQQQQQLQVRSATSSLAHTYAARALDLEAGRGRLPYAAGAIGLAVAVADELVSIDVFDRPQTCAHIWPRLIEGALIDGLAADGDALRVSGAEVDAMLASLRASPWTRVLAVGEGDEYRARNAEGAASLLCLDDRLVHLGIATAAPEVPHARGSSPQVHSRPMRAELPPALARYRIVERIGVGGTKEVFRATDTQGGPDVAIARLPLIDNDTFRHEIAVVRNVRSEHVPQIFEALVDEYGDGYIVMERCDGPNLAALANGRALTLTEAAPLLVAFARGLRAIHEARVLHRDIKLENVMLSSASGRLELKIVDFGMSAQARMATTAVGAFRIGGTYPYMAREVIMGLPLDARTDVYAFGVCCYRLLTGEFPIVPGDDEGEFCYLERLRAVDRHDLSRLPSLPGGMRRLIGRLLEVEQVNRPYMPEVVAELERELGTPALQLPRRMDAGRAPTPSLERVRRIDVPLAAPEHVLVTGCMQAPIVALSVVGEHTDVSAYRQDGVQRWSHRLAGRFTAGMRADLDGDGMREIYLAGPGRLAVLGASGAERLARDVAAYAARPTLIALPSTTMPRIAIDGRVFDPATGQDAGLLPHVYEGRDRELVDSVDLRGLSYNGFASQAFRGDQATGAAILFRPGETAFLVAHLEEHRAMPRVQLSVYGPGGARRTVVNVVDGDLVTGDRDEIMRLHVRTNPLFDARHAPLALLDGNQSIVIVPLLGGDPAIPPTIAAFELPSGRVLWRAHCEGSTDGRAILADLDGDGRPELVVGDGRSLVAYDPWTGAASAAIPCRGMPVAYGDPFATGQGHLVLADGDGLELWRANAAWPCGTMQWAGPRADLWRTGTLRSDGLPLGPL